jgi:hypothetical protein
MKIIYDTEIDVSLFPEDIQGLRDGKSFGEMAYKYPNETLFDKIYVEVIPSNERFFSRGGVGESFGEDIFKAYCILPPKTLLQKSLFPEKFPDELIIERELTIKISMPLLEKVVNESQGGGSIWGIARGASVGHFFDRLNLYINP